MPVGRRTFFGSVPALLSSPAAGFGGDYRYPELTYAHAKLARRNVARVLAEKVEDGFCSEDERLELATMLLRDNPHALFGKRREHPEW